MIDNFAQQLIQVSVGGFLGLFVGLPLSDLVEVLVNFIAKFATICKKGELENP